MANLPNRLDLFRKGLDSLNATSGTRINPDVATVPGSDVNIMLGAMSLMGEEIVSNLANCMRGLFIETARGEQLDRVAFDRYGLTRFPATPARCLLHIIIDGEAGGVIPAGTRVKTSGGVQFATDVDAVFQGGFEVRDVPATALEAGVDSNVTESSLTSWVDQIYAPSSDVSNEFASGGTAKETDVQFRGRIRNFFPTLQRGTLQAIEFGALQVPGITTARAIETTNLTVGGIAIPAAAVQLVVADRTGVASTPLIQAVKDNLINYRAAGIPVIVTSGEVEYEDVEWDLSYLSGVDTISAQEQVRAVTVAAMQYSAPNEIMYRANLIAAAKTVPGVIVSEDSLVIPAGDIVPADEFTILRIKPEDITF